MSSFLLACNLWVVHIIFDRILAVLKSTQDPETIGELQPKPFEIIVYRVGPSKAN